MLDLLTGYEGEFVTEDSLLTALQVIREVLKANLKSYLSISSV